MDEGNDNKVVGEREGDQKIRGEWLSPIEIGEEDFKGQVLEKNKHALFSDY